VGTVLLTGGSGFIGGRLLPRLVQQGHEVILLGRANGVARGDHRHIPVTTFAPQDIAKALASVRFDAVMHLAASGVKPYERDPIQIFTTNVAATQALVEAAALSGAKTFIHAGSSAEYSAEATSSLGATRPLESSKLYGASKAAATLLVSSMGPALGLASMTLRLFHVYGPGEAAHRLLPSLVSRLTSGESVPLSPGLQERDFIHVDDVCSAMLLALSTSSSYPGSIVDICTGTPSTVRCFAETVADVLEADRGLLHFGDLPMRPDETMSMVGNPAPAERILGFHPQLTLDDGIRQAILEGRND
jgi:nucleoside-diphosphate-sugar epimerase